MVTKSVVSRATNATRAGCVHLFSVGWVRIRLLKARQQKCAEDDLRHIILQLNTKGFTASKITVIVTYKNKAVIIVLQETHCTTADKLVIPSF